MSREGMKAAQEHGEQLPSFPDQPSAELALFGRRDELIRQLTAAADRSTTFSADFSPESLKSLEKWYFELWETKSFSALGTERAEFERWMAMYFGEVMVRNAPDFEWVVEEYSFAQGKYSIGVRKPLLAIMLGRYTDLYARRSNKRKQSVWREYRQYAG